MEILPAVIYAALPIIGVVIGATLQYWFSKSSEERKRQQNLRTQSYVDFIRSASGLAVALENNDKRKVQEFTALLTDAKTRVAIYGSKEVVEAVADFLRRGVRTGIPRETRRLFVTICQTIREESLLKNQDVPDKEISQLLFSKEDGD